jgi:threonine/homoserine/homoserine lactone efflux protein
MIQIIYISIPILISDIINPVLLAAVVFALGSKRAFSNAWAVLIGWLTVYFAAGVLIGVGLESIMAFLANPRPIDFWIQLVVAGLLIWFGINLLRKKNPRKKEPDHGDAEQLGIGKSFLIGATINLIGLPFAVPYFAVLDQIVKSDLTWIPALTVLLIYNLLYILPFSLLLFIRLIYKEKSDAIFSKINQKMDTLSNILMPLIVFGIALVLLIDSFLYFFTGVPWL